MRDWFRSGVTGSLCKTSVHYALWRMKMIAFLMLIMMQKIFLHYIVSAAAFFSSFFFQLLVICLVELCKACYAFANRSGVSLGVELFHVPL